MAGALVFSSGKASLEYVNSAKRVNPSWSPEHLQSSSREKPELLVGKTDGIN